MTKKDLSSLKPNSHISKESKGQNEDEKIDKVVTNTPKARKKSSFFNENINDVGQYLVYDVVMPALKDTLSSLVKNFVDLMLYGEPKVSNVKRNGKESYVSYASYSRQDDMDRMHREARGRSEPSRYPPRRTAQRFDDIVIDSRNEAEMVLDRMVDLLETYDVVPVSSFYDLVGITPKYTDNNYGWNDLGRARIEQVRGGYIIDLPRPIVID